MTPESVLEVFNHWKAIMGHSRARMDLKRATVIRERLRDGYSTEDLMLAIDGCCASDWHMGNNDRRTVYDDIGLILRDAAHVDRFISMGEKAHQMIQQREQRREKEEAEKMPPTEEQIGKVRELLKSVRLRRVA